MSLITSYEVKKYSPLDESFPDSQVCIQIDRAEWIAFSQCWIGAGLYDSLIADLEPSPTVCYDPDVTYNEGDKVSFDGCPYVSNVNSNTSSPEDGGWTLMQKFKTASNNNLWIRGSIRAWLAYKVALACTTYGAYMLGAEGLTKLNRTENTKRTSVNKDEHLLYKKKLEHDADDELERVYSYMVATGAQQASSSGDSSSCDPCSDGSGNGSAGNCPSPSNNRKRRIYTKRRS